MDIPDSLYLMEEAEGAQDPFFGLMESHQLPSPYKIQVHFMNHASLKPYTPEIIIKLLQQPIVVVVGGNRLSMTPNSNKLKYIDYD